MLITAQNLTKQYGSKLIVKDLSLEIKPGRVLSLLGPNGAGKSTVVKMLTGQTNPSSGQIQINNEVYTNFPQVYRNQLGIMPQEVVVWDDLTLTENLEFSATLYGLDNMHKKQRIQKMISDLRLNSEKNTLARDLSGGYRRRLNLAISIIHDPEVIFLDEPSPGIDTQSRIFLRDYFRSLVDSGDHSIVLTDHYLEEAEKLSDYVIIMDHGKVIAEGVITDLKAKYTSGSLLQIFMKWDYQEIMEKICYLFASKFHQPMTSGNCVNILIQNVGKSLNTALKIVHEHNLEIDNIRIKEPTLEDVFLILTGRDVRE